jgi:glycosyltransferase involved in cell wall biosynthesis
MSLGRILFVAAELDNGGSERHAAILLPALRERGFELTVLTLSREGGVFHELQTRGVDTQCAGMRRRIDVAGFGRAVSAARIMPDLIVSQGISAQVFAQVLAAPTRTPHLTIEHSPPSLPLRRHQQALLRLVAPCIDSVVAVARAQLPRLIRLGYRRERIRVISNGIPPLTPARSRDVTRTELDLRDREFVALLVANLSPLKRHDLFLSSVVEANRSDSQIRGLMAGGASFDPAADARMFDLAARTHGVVQFLGHRLDVPDLVHAADVLCLTSETESMPMSILEAMSLARPVVSTDVGSIREVVSPGTTGILMPPEDCGPRLTTALLELAADPVRATRLGRAGQMRYGQFFSADRMIDRYARTFSELCDSGGARVGHPRTLQSEIS